MFDSFFNGVIGDAIGGGYMEFAIPLRCARCEL
jgi:hypothetical protein